MDFKIIDPSTGTDLFFEIKPGFDLYRPQKTSIKAWDYMISALKKEQINTQLGSQIRDCV